MSPDRTPIGQAWLREQLRLQTAKPAHQSFIVSGVRRTEVHDGETTELYPRAYATAPDALAHLRFALKHEPFDLGIIVAALKAVGPGPLEAWVRAEPTGAFARRAWFLYETLVGKTLDVHGVSRGGYVPALDPRRHLVAAPRRSPRHRVHDNLLGGAGLCPTVRKTAVLDARIALHLDEQARVLVDSYDPVLLTRAVSYLYTKETRSSFAIEGEVPDDRRAARFIGALRAPSFDPTRKAELIALQGLIVEPRYAATDWRSFQNFVGETVGGHRQRVHYVCPRPEDVPALMEGWAELARRLLEDTAVDAVVAAAVLGFAFVFIHPFEDGNGRLHRFLFHHALAKRGFSPPGVIFPVSASILRDRRSYDAVLESFSRPLGELVDWRWAQDEEIVVEGDTADLYRFFDATRLAEYLYERVDDTVARDLKEELAFVALYDRALAETRAVLEMPDKKASLFVRLVLENGGRLAKGRRDTFAELSDDEIERLEAAVRRAAR